MNIGYKNAINFLLYTYFGITLEMEKESEKEKFDSMTIIKRLVVKAYNDATQQGAFNALIEKDEEGKRIRKKANDARDEATKYIINAVMDFNGAYASWHKELCNKLCVGEDCIYKDVLNKRMESLFSYGNAQKWVNMTVKYIYIVENILKEINPEHSFEKVGRKFTEIADELDIPIDSYIIEGLWEKDELWKNNDINSLLKKDKKGKYSSDKVKAWSRWDDKEYDNFRKNLSADCTIEWECSKWIEISEKRKKDSWIDKITLNDNIDT